MLFKLYFILFATAFYLPVYGQRLLTQRDARILAESNQRNLKVANLSLQQQEELLGAVKELENPEIFAEANPYESLVIGVQQRFNLPGVNKSRAALQNERIRLARLHLHGSQIELRREVSLIYLQVQYQAEKLRLLRHQDSIYQDIKTTAKRFFDAGQINKLEELTATSQAGKIKNDLIKTESDLAAETELLRFFTANDDPIYVEPFTPDTFLVNFSNTGLNNIQQEILQQEIAVKLKEVDVQRSALLPQLTAGVTFPTTSDYQRPIGFQAGISLPIWRKQYRSRVKVAETGVEIAKAQKEIELNRLNARYKVALANVFRERQTLNYFTSVALPQADSIIAISRRLFDGGQVNYMESLRNLQLAFEIFLTHLEAHKSFQEAIIELNYLNGSL